MRTAAEILARIEGIDEYADFFGAERSDLIHALPYEHAKRYLDPSKVAHASAWADSVTDTDDKVRQAAIEYLPFAFGKAEDHRGLSAERSISHFRAWLWLLDELPEHWDESDRYRNYGAPLLFEAARLLGAPVPTDPGLVRMSRHLPCEPDCMAGCS